MDSNIFTTKIHDIIIPSNATLAHDKVKDKAKEDRDYVKILTTASPKEGGLDQMTLVNLRKISHLFIVMDVVETDLKILLNSSPVN